MGLKSRQAMAQKHRRRHAMAKKELSRGTPAPPLAQSSAWRPTGRPSGRGCPRRSRSGNVRRTGVPSRSAGKKVLAGPSPQGGGPTDCWAGPACYLKTAKKQQPNPPALGFQRKNLEVKTQEIFKINLITTFFGAWRLLRSSRIDFPPALGAPGESATWLGVADSTPPCFRHAAKTLPWGGPLPERDVGIPMLPLE